MRFLKILLGFIVLIVIFGCLWISTSVFVFVSNTPFKLYGELNSEKIVSVSDSNLNCDQSLWDYVYSPSRLYIIDKCVSLVGEVKGLKESPDADMRIFVRPDKDYVGFTNIFNDLMWDQNVMLEVICYSQEDKDSKEFEYCKGYTNKVMIPGIGDKVKVYGSLVVDKPWGWKEIHPVSSIEILQK